MRLMMSMILREVNMIFVYKEVSLDLYCIMVEGFIDFFI